MALRFNRPTMTDEELAKHQIMRDFARGFVHEMQTQQLTPNDLESLFDVIREEAQDRTEMVWSK